MTGIRMKRIKMHRPVSLYDQTSEVDRQEEKKYTAEFSSRFEWFLIVS